MDYIKTAIHYCGECLKALGKSWKQQSEDEKEREKIFQQQCHQQCCQQVQLALQEALFQVLRKTNISPILCRVKYAQELLPYGYKQFSNQYVFYYRWAKTSTDGIAVSNLFRYMNIINIAINAERSRLMHCIACYDAYTQTLIINQYQMLYNGFRIISCKDATDSIILAVVI